ncbi:hypothetical protein [Falsiroseomonas selenitidurans]|uniref:Uncharacterized protein n=1 Tax=Falsiroseomonas selenitidurans TaxID=2716335 RepID=A0ABX1E2Q4_9PROT|nr:hypothetical protein [Falsiroseomonas selenitidurans]NKC31323.1 hypothetical protein [Falsiroseomonas selenitidurans]
MAHHTSADDARRNPGAYRHTAIFPVLAAVALACVAVMALLENAVR